MDGILLVNKEKGITSYDVIRKLKRLMPKGTKLGHAGTLDPFATGLLIVMLGRATKLNEKFHELDKKYKVSAELGFETDSQDITGQRVNISESMSHLSKDKLLDIIRSFEGELDQIPPQFSAKKVNGKPAYLLARKGVPVRFQPKKIIIKSIQLLDFSFPFFALEVVCSAGTYIRTLVADIGRKTGLYATAVELERLNIGKFSVENAIRSADILPESSEMIYKRIVSLDKINFTN